jgi:hypothetical protein
VDACVGREEEEGVGVGLGVHEEFLKKHQYLSGLCLGFRLSVSCKSVSLDGHLLGRCLVQ